MGGKEQGFSDLFTKSDICEWIDLKELSFLYLLITFPEIISHKIEEISEVSLSNMEHENLKIELLNIAFSNYWGSATLVIF